MIATSVKSLLLRALLGVLFVLVLSGCNNSLERSVSVLGTSNDSTAEVALGESDTDTRLATSATVTGKAPCVVEEPTIDPCRPRNVSTFDLFSSPADGSVAFSQEKTPGVEDLLEKGLRLAEASPVHIVVRGTADAASVRCGWRGIARTPEQREDAIRFWLGLDEDDHTPDATYLAALFNATLSVLEPAYPETAKSNFRAIARGGESTEYLFLACYADYTVQEYLLGAGPTTLTAAYDRMAEAASYELYRREHDADQFEGDPLQKRGDYESSLADVVAEAEESLAARIAGRENVVFLAPMGAHNAIAVEAWQAVVQWDLQTDEGGVVQAVRYGVPASDPESTQTLANLKSRITTAATPPAPTPGSTPEPGPTRIPNASGLTQYYLDIGAYGDITPDDGETTTFTPAQPPPVPTCAGGTAVTNPGTDRGLVHDCEALLEAKDTLRGTASLDWSASSTVTSWEGVTTGGTPSRVTKVELGSESLSGSIPAELGTLFELTHLDLSSNSVTGDIPADLGWLHNLTSLKLSGNSLTGCIPVALEGVAANDLSSLNLLYCRPPAPGGLAGTAAEYSVALSWDAVSNTSKYRLEHRPRGAGDWVLASDTLTGTTHTVSGLSCGSPHQFRAGAYGSGTTHTAEWSDWTAALTVETSECLSPVFDQEAYAVGVVEHASVGTAVGTVSADDPNGDTVTYRITGGNQARKFALGRSTGNITTTGSLDASVASSYTLTVEAGDGTNTTEVAVEITVLAPTISLTGVPESMVQWDLEQFTVGAENLDPSLEYRMRTEASGGGIVFHRTTCGYTAQDVVIPAGNTSYLRQYPLHACTTAGGTVTATLFQGNTTEATATQAVTVTEPTTPRLPSVEILGLEPSVEEGERGNFRVRAFYLALTGSYDLRVTTDSANLGFDGACADQQRDYAVGLGNASNLVSLYLYGCAAPGGTVTATLLEDDTATVATATGNVTVTEPPPGPTVEILGLAEAMAEGQTDEFEVALTHLGTSSSYFLDVSTDNGNLGFDGGCADRLEEPTVTYGQPSHTESLTLHACAAPGGTVTATLSGVRGVLDTATWDVTVVTPPTEPPVAPLGLGVTLSGGAFSLSWTALDGAAKYEAQRKTDAPDAQWTALPETTGVSAAFSPRGGPECSTEYQFRVRAYGDGVSYTEMWGTESGVESAETATCNPEFDQDPYSFDVAEDAAVDDPVGTVSATDPDAGDTVTYSITAGNTGGAFDIDDETGAITVAAELDHETGDSYALQVQADDGNGGTATATVNVEVTDVAEDLPPAPTGLDVSLTDGVFTVTWDAVAGADNYEVEYRTGGDEGVWTSAGTATTASLTYTPDCGTAYDFQVRSHGDGTAYAADWGAYSNPVPATTGACNEAPVFAAESYGFTVSEEVPVGQTVGTVTADDADQGDTVSYFITAGNDAGKFAIDGTTGTITVKASLADVAGTLYTLTVEAGDGTGASAVTVTVQVSAMCSTGIAVPDPSGNPGLVGDCLLLLTHGDTLAGTVTLDWAAHTAMTDWEGVILGGTPRRVTGVDLSRVSDNLTGSIPPELAGLSALESLVLSFNRLTGTIPSRLGELSNLRDLQLTGNALRGEIPPELGGLSELTGLWIYNNQLTGTIPTELGQLTKLEGLGLSGNQLRGGIPPELGNLTELLQLWLQNNHLSGTIPAELTELANLWLLHLTDNDLVGCIPPSLHDIRTNDLHRLGLPDCAEGTVAAPEGLTGSLAESSFSVSWSAVTGADLYEAQHRTGGAAVEWASLPATAATGATYAPSGGPDCGTGYEFRVRARGDGHTHVTYWGPYSGAAAVATDPCNQPPVFDEDPYNFSVAEDASEGHTVGTVSATDPDAGDTLAYSITAGNGDGKFDIDGGSGAVTVAGGLDYETGDSYALMVQADDGNGGTDTAAVNVSVTDVAEDLPPAPTNVDTALTDAVFTVTWDAVAGADNYQVDYRTGGERGAWAVAGTATAASLTYAPTGGPACGTTYDFRVRAYGDGVTYAADWGGYSGADPVTTDACNEPPVFDSDSYAFSVAEDAATGHTVGTVSATDPDDDQVYYTIISGNSERRIGVVSTSGTLTLVRALDYETTDSYTLTVRADDLRGGRDTATVEITVTDVPEELPPAPTGLGVSLEEGTFSISWSAASGAGSYQVQYRTGGDEGRWTSAGTATATSLAYAPTGGPACGTTYDFRVRAYGDGVVYAAAWGEASSTESVAIGSCNQPPAFVASAYAFTISDGASTGDSVGSVSATDADTADTLTYSITGGNGDGKFGIDGSTGAITVEGALDYADTGVYTLTVQAGDGNGGTATATVTVSLTLAACSNGTVVPSPAQNPRLVRDCSILLTARDTLAEEGSLNWSADLAMNSWQGVTVERAESLYLKLLMLTDAGLTGTIPASFGGLKDLRRLDLDENELTGGIPAALGGMTNLDQLYLQDNQLSGGIPGELANLTYLSYLHLYQNRLTGSIPAKFGELNGLEELLLDDNRLDGAIPAELGGIEKLRVLFLRNNQFNGAIPAALEGLANLTQLYLEGNGFTGCIPAGLEDVADNDLDLLGLSYCGSGSS